VYELRVTISLSRDISFPTALTMPGYLEHLAESKRQFGDVREMCRRFFEIKRAILEVLILKAEEMVFDLTYMQYTWSP
jgi:hypothetical protein